jgi:hypothetical protein
MALSIAVLNLVEIARAADGDLVPLNLNLPQAAFKGTPQNIQTNTYTEPYPDLDKPPKPMMVPSGLKNLAKGAKLTTSDKNVTAETLAKLTDGDKEASDQGLVMLRKGTQFVQLDLGNPSEIFAIVVWHSFSAPKVYHDVVIQAADNADFTENVRTLFNNDQDNTSGLGVGTDREYFETHLGRVFDAKGAKARFLRFYSKGSTESVLNEYLEIEVYGRPAK